MRRMQVLAASIAAVCGAAQAEDTKLEVGDARFDLAAAAQPDETTSTDSTGSAGVGDYVDDLFTNFNEGWEGSIAAGLFGSSGNTERYNFRGEIEGERDTELNRLTGQFVYSWARDDGDLSENRARLNFRNEFKIPDSKWFGFGQLSFEYDEFQAWDTRLNGFAGPGYTFIDEEEELFKVRAGLGATREFGSSDNTIQPEALIAAEYQKDLTERQNIGAELEIFPALDEAGDGRVVARGYWELQVDPEVNMKLRAGFEDRYDSRPEGAKRNDVDFFILLSWDFGGSAEG